MAVSSHDEKFESLLSTYLENEGKILDEITATEIQKLYHNLRPENSISLRQVQAAIQAVCFCDLCFKEEVLDVLNEIDRRSFLIRDVEWEFEMLDREKCGTITEEQACFLFKALQGKSATKKCKEFLSGRAMAGSRVALQEIEVLLCDSPETELTDEEN